MKLEEYLKEIEAFLKDYIEKAHCNKYILGISGGVDSSLCAALARNAVGKDRLLCLILPIESQKADENDALDLAKQLDLNYEIVDGTEIFRGYVDTFKKLGQDFDRSTLGNLKARIRMSILYAYAQKYNGLVIGTDNADERYTGYFTKHGDGACDILPIAHLLKGEVVQASKILGISDQLAERVPTASLFEGQTDETEMGVTYKDLDRYILGGKVDETVEKRIQHLHKISEHKRVPTPMPKEFDRGE
ncbi:MAG: NAD(+) synthase [Bacilli bacterium]|nr:NAD(+) synthase [Bacilli bacterium]